MSDNKLHKYNILNLSQQLKINVCQIIQLEYFKSLSETQSLLFCIMKMYIRITTHQKEQ